MDSIENGAVASKKPFHLTPDLAPLGSSGGPRGKSAFKI